MRLNRGEVLCQGTEKQRSGDGWRLGREAGLRLHPAAPTATLPHAPSTEALARNRKPYSDLLKWQGIYRLSDQAAQGG